MADRLDGKPVRGKMQNPLDGGCEIHEMPKVRKANVRISQVAAKVIYDSGLSVSALLGALSSGKSTKKV